MWGRIIGVLAGLALLAEAYLLWRPEALGAWRDPDLGPFTPYRTIVAALAAVLGAAVAIAALQRSSETRADRKASFDWDARQEAAPAAPPPAAAPAGAAKDPFALEPFPSLDREPEPIPAEPEPEPKPPPILALPAPAPAPAALPAPVASGSDYGRYLACIAEGDALRASGQLSEAIEPYGDALTIARARRAAWPDDPAVQRDLASALTHVADVHDRDGRLDAALDLHQQSLDIRRALAAAAPHDLAARKSLSLGLEKMADTREARGHRSRARDLFRERLTLMEGLAAVAPGDADAAKDIAATRERLAELDEALAPLPEPVFSE